ncbi:unnamed protein product [Acanthoscelides obtectus]|uniref:Uncharacterized protein n=1 Tax=Acanthoscelides obtectus TaxID=200917 RepID=A0A9P0L6E7_ACAOB|nr:unnamed protein product [Acanthoscelides obtectus]CAK1652859.1 hypothetical protein AOBTE_LOCUS17943 [Acanthoscelides obtectus]
MAPKKLLRGRVLHSQSCEIVNNIIKFMKKEAEEGISIPLTNYRDRVLAATGVSKNTYQRICKESKKKDLQGPSTSFQNPKKRKNMKKWKLDSFTPHQIKSIREIIYNFYMMEKKFPTLKGIRQKILDRGVLSEDVAELSISTLSRLLKKIGFKWQKMQDKRKVLCESYDIRAKRIKFLKKLLSIVNGLLIFKSGTKTGDYHNEMNSKNFMTWVERQLLPNLPERLDELLEKDGHCVLRLPPYHPH